VFRELALPIGRSDWLKLDVPCYWLMTVKRGNRSKLTQAEDWLDRWENEHDTAPPTYCEFVHE
jgi:hypothetical protein